MTAFFSLANVPPPPFHIDETGVCTRSSSTDPTIYKKITNYTHSVFEELAKQIANMSEPKKMAPLVAQYIAEFKHENQLKQMAEAATLALFFLFDNVPNPMSPFTKTP